MANMIAVTAEQYQQVIAFRELCLQIGDLMAPLGKVKLADGNVEGFRRVLVRQAKQIAALPEATQPAMSAQDLKQTHKLLASAFRCAGVLDEMHHMGVPGTETDTWSAMRTAAQGLLGLPGKPWANKP